MFKLRHLNISWKKIFTHFKFNGCNRSEKNGTTKGWEYFKYVISYSIGYHKKSGEVSVCKGQGWKAIYASIHHVFLRHILAIQCYTAYKIYYCSMALYLKVLNWSACSPHLLPNWKHLAHHETKNKTKKTQDWLRQEWDNIALPEIQQLVFSIPRHLRTVAKKQNKRGDATV